MTSFYKNDTGQDQVSNFDNNLIIQFSPLGSWKNFKISNMTKIVVLVFTYSKKTQKSDP